jgi:hypothetical protein
MDCTSAYTGGGPPSLSRELTYTGAKETQSIEEMRAETDALVKAVGLEPLRVERAAALRPAAAATTTPAAAPAAAPAAVGK